MKRVVIKIGSSTLVKDGKVDAVFVGHLASECANLMHDEGIQPIIVSSGSIALGLEVLGIHGERPDDMPTLQAAASIGQVGLIRQYTDTFACFGVTVGQILMTRATTGQRESYLHARDTIERLLELGVVPIINENDTVAVEEIRFGDNDTLAAMVATSIHADLVVLLSDIDGLYTADPRKNEDAELLNTVSKMSEEIENGAGGVGSRSGSGGMLTKIAAARVLMAAGIPMVICEGHRRGAITDAVHGRQVGTTFFDESSNGLAARKSWIALGGKVKGRVACDEGACNALLNRGGSLLPVGIASFEGAFAAGDPVDVVDLQGRIIGRGLAGYAADELSELLGKHGEREFINRDELVIF
ncbi:MAG: glutamate 5-kinase [Coriobacteriales bacterium]